MMDRINFLRWATGSASTQRMLHAIGKRAAVAGRRSFSSVEQRLGALEGKLGLQLNAIQQLLEQNGAPLADAGAATLQNAAHISRPTSFPRKDVKVTCALLSVWLLAIVNSAISPFVKQHTGCAAGKHP